MSNNNDRAVPDASVRDLTVQLQSVSISDTNPATNNASSSSTARPVDQGPAAAAASSDPMQDLAVCLGVSAVLARFSPRLPNVNLATQRSGLLAALRIASTINTTTPPPPSQAQQTSAAAVLQELELSTHALIPMIALVGPSMILKQLIAELEVRLKADNEKMAAETRAQKAEQERQKAETRAEVAETRAEVAEEKARHVFLLELDKGLPPLVGCFRPSSITTASSRHPPATAVAGTFNCHPHLFQKYRTAGTTTLTVKLGYDSEATIQQLVSAVLMTLIRSIPQHLIGHAEDEDTSIHFLQNASLNSTSANSQKSDLWYISTLGTGRGAFEVKCPSRASAANHSVEEDYRLAKEDMNDANIIGQLFDYLQELRMTFNLNHVFGVLTNYKFWRIFWLDDPQSIAMAGSDGPLPLPGRPDLDGFAAGAPVPDFSSTNAFTANLPDGQELPRQLYASSIFRHDDPQLFPHLLSVLYKMSRAVPSRATGGTVALQMSQADRSWQAIPTPVLNFSAMVSKQAEHFWLLFRLGGGGDGTAWLATNGKGGKVCVVKIFLPGTLAEDIQAECERWKIWPGLPATFTHTLNEVGLCLVMPFLKTYGQPRTDPAELDAIRTAITIMAEAGYRHGDLDWRHVGFYRVNGVLHAALLDLSRVTRIQDNDIEQGKRLMLERLGMLAEAST
ncbi:hypothetical protein CAOG_02853 [Capsaspora owczarzaki ATCC 30864]|uniref:hypothetical protein n=1 Tax=Capsaspora owczarzaki (strain ATCC 30864) TaxID=595528 RepID=UPI0003526F3C|nr:hypothetical protein CAOG_02853 [Capsaspora owczarzaki ATCC 30864]|eukprot:XP_004348668.2 hypothetical protein CAOG_02853 [Capsaspora owczarzaki ATCC 30864]